MREVMETQWFQIKREKTIYLIFAVFLIVGVGECASSMFGDTFKTMGEACGSLAAMLLPEPYLFAEYFVLLVTPIVMGMDYKDHLIHCDVLYGHSRISAFWGRLIPTLVVVSMGSLIIATLPILVVTAVAGWGDVLPFSLFLVRRLEFVIFALRLAGEMVLVLMLCKKIYLTYVMAVITMIAETYIAMSSPGNDSGVLSSGATYLLMNFPVRIKQHLKAAPEFIYQRGAASNDLKIMLIMSVLIFAACLVVSVSVFDNDDM